MTGPTEQKTAASCKYPCSDRGSGRRSFRRDEVDVEKARGSGRREADLRTRKLANLG
ncbi:MAG: hypothetical protein HC838_04235 [Spirulinaceae cyanobacterium RM2_2_10]|nr:hypothetical protein [Spirulinaceae cyanobacterium SM2_1_0]NJO19429.1 hypothetical protein [Spirulinaceae cyanobacterium RM2_2_10]